MFLGKQKAVLYNGHAKYVRYKRHWQNAEFFCVLKQTIRIVFTDAEWLISKKLLRGQLSVTGTFFH